MPTFTNGSTSLSTLKMSKYFIILFVVSLLNLFYLTRGSEIPQKWDESLTLSYQYSGGMREEYLKINIKGSEVTWDEKTSGSSVKQYSVCVVTYQQMNEILAFLHENKIDKIELKESIHSVCDGVSYSMSLTKNGKDVFRIGNSAYDELKVKDKDKFYKSVEVIKNLKKVITCK